MISSKKNSSTIFHFNFLYHLFIATPGSIYRLPTEPEREPCQCNLATCYLIDGRSEEIDKPFKRVVTWTKASCTLAHTQAHTYRIFTRLACAYTLGRIPLDSNRITIEIVKRAFVPNLRNRIKVTTTHE